MKYSLPQSPVACARGHSKKLSRCERNWRRFGSGLLTCLATTAAVSVCLAGCKSLHYNPDTGDVDVIFRAAQTNTAAR